MRLLHACLLAFSLAPLGMPAAAQDTKPGRTFSVWVRADAVRFEHTVTAVPADVWRALPRAFADLGYEGGPSARGEMLYLTRSMTITGRLYEGELNSTYLDCGRTAAGNPAADTYQVNFALLARVLPADTAGWESVVEVVLDGTARDRTQSTNAVFCTGTGKIERALLYQLEKQLGLR